MQQSDKSSAANRYKRQAEDARRAIDARIAPRATPPAPVKSAAKCSRCGLTNCSCVGGHGGPLRPTPFGCSEEYAKAAGDQYRNAKHAESVVMFR